MVGRAYDLGTIVHVTSTTGTPVVVLDRWTVRGTPDSTLARDGVPIRVHSDAPYENLNTRTTFRIPVAPGAAFTYHHCVAVDQPMQSRPATLPGARPPPAARGRRAATARRLRPPHARGERPRLLSRGVTDTAHWQTGAHDLAHTAAGSSPSGLGAGGLATADMVLNIGPQHPSTHGVLRLRLTLDGERIVSAEPIIGYMHRGAEKLFEVRDYRQIIVLANRHDWLSAFANELGVVLAVERMLGMEVPERAVWARTLLAELNRVLNHLMFLGSYPLELGAITPVFYAFRERETLQAVMEEVSGGRMHYMFNRVGGLKEDLPGGLARAASGGAVADVRARLPDIENLVLGNEIFRARTRGVGVLAAEHVHAYGVSGPIARASGVDFDLRRDEPYLAYGELPDVLRVVTRTEGDCLARFECLLEQV